MTRIIADLTERISDDPRHPRSIYQYNDMKTALNLNLISVWRAGRAQSEQLSHKDATHPCDSFRMRWL
jgi:hypothetical protein